MSTQRPSAEPAESSYVSTCHLPPPQQLRDLVAEAYEHHKANSDGSLVVLSGQAA
jgi:hypothetical protein